MKKQTLIILSLVFALNLSAYALPDTTTPEITFTICDGNCSMELIQDVKKDLIQSNWLETLQAGNVNVGVERIYKFQEIGRLEIITSYDDGHSETESMVWRISSNEENIILTLTDLSDDESTTYTIEQTSAGLTLTDQLLQKKLNWIFQ